MNLSARPVQIYTHRVRQPNFQADVPVVWQMHDAAVERTINETIQHLYNTLIAQTGYAENPDKIPQIYSIQIPHIGLYCYYTK